MLRKGFLKRLSDFVIDSIAAIPREFDRAAEEFELEKLIRSSVPEKIENVQMLFSEWLVFDRKTKAFGDKTGLEYFLESPKVTFTEDERSAYADLLDAFVGFFEVKKVTTGESITVVDMSDNEYTIHDVNSSLSSSPRQTLLTRIGCVAGTYHMVGSMGLTLPIHVGQTTRRKTDLFDANSMDAHDIAVLVSKDIENDTEWDSGDLDISELEAARLLDETLASCGMQHMYSSASVRKWQDRRRFAPSFTLRATFFLLPDALTDTERDSVMSAVTTFVNALPHKGGRKSRRQAFHEQNQRDTIFDFEAFGTEDYLEDLESAHALMHSGKPVDAYEQYVRIMETLLHDKTPFFHAFRIYANAALACLMTQDERWTALGRELNAAALRLNPQYDFGIRQRELYIEPLEDLSNIPKRDRALVKNIYAILRKEGEKMYKRTPFYKYEQFLQKCGVSLSFKTKTTPTIFNSENGREVKIGRNDPCPCGSGKKYKKCCDS